MGSSMSPMFYMMAVMDDHTPLLNLLSQVWVKLIPRMTTVTTKLPTSRKASCGKLTVEWHSSPPPFFEWDVQADTGKALRLV